jgi:L-lactate dehydrogenase complex protein LldE
MACLFVTCLGDTFYPGAVRATVNVLRRFGVDVACPQDQTCCGQPMFNAGYFEQSREAARYFIDVFRRTSDPVIAPSSSCVSMIRHSYSKLFADEPDYLRAAGELADRTWEFSEYLVKKLNINLGELGARFNDSVTYHYSCHFRPLGIVDEPITLIEQIAGIDYRPVERLRQCCGFGGTFSLSFPEVSEAIVRDKVECIGRTGANWLIFSDAGCAMNITGYAHRAGRPIKAMHLAELIDRSLGEPS